MKSLFIEPTYKTPRIEFNTKTNLLLFSGRALPEDAKEFFVPLKNWLTDYFETNPPKTTVLFRLNYYNTASSKNILEILYILKSAIILRNDIKITWEYEEFDDEIKESGEDFAEIVDIPIITKCVENAYVE